MLESFSEVGPLICVCSPVWVTSVIGMGIWVTQYGLIYNLLLTIKIASWESESVVTDRIQNNCLMMHHNSCAFNIWQHAGIMYVLMDR